jgi:nucleotide-binding universal stress UspA family protein
VTLLAAGKDVPEEDMVKVRAAFAERPIEYRHVSAPDPVAAILEQANLGYGVMALGATDQRIAGTLVSPLVDQLLARSPLPVVIVRRGRAIDPDAPPRFRRILVPAVGTLPGRAAQEVAYSIARRLDARVLLAHVVPIPSIDDFLRGDSAGGPPRAEAAARVVEEAAAFASEMGVEVDARIRTGSSVPEALLSLAGENRVDLLVLAANLRQLTGRPFLGHGVEHLLEHSETTVVLVSVPAGWGAPPGARRS